MDIFQLFISAIFVNNIVLAQYLGNCPYLGCSKEKGVALGMALRPARKDKLLKVQRYMGMGLTIKEICLLLGLRKSAAYGLMNQARELGLLESRLPARPVQGNLLALDDKGVDA